MSTDTAEQQEQQSTVPAVGSAAPEDTFMEHVLVGMAAFYPPL